MSTVDREVKTLQLLFASVPNELDSQSLQHQPSKESIPQSSEAVQMLRQSCGNTLHLARWPWLRSSEPCSPAPHRNPPASLPPARAAGAWLRGSGSPRSRATPPRRLAAFRVL